jgi:fructose-1,6-bisphosphatase I
MALEDSIASSVGVTLDRFIKRQQSAYPGASGELSQLLRDIALASKIINREINRAGLADVTGAFGLQNTHGEHQQKLDVIAHVRFVRALRNGGECCAIASEEEDDIIYTGNDDGKYVVAMDPLDGSSNIDVNVSIGTIFSIYRRVSPIGSRATLADFMQGGRQQVAAGYVLYGSSTILVYTTGQGVNGFTYEHSLGEYFLSHSGIQTPTDSRFYSVNETNFEQFAPAVQQYVLACRARGMSARYIGSLVGDFHRNMLKGGIYLYPATAKTPDGKLRLLYEAYPLAMLAEQSGGAATDGGQPILDVPPRFLHQRTPLYIGTAAAVGEGFKGSRVQGSRADARRLLMRSP